MLSIYTPSGLLTIVLGPLRCEVEIGTFSQRSWLRSRARFALGRMVENSASNECGMMRSNF